MHFIKPKAILSTKNGMNIYRGCLHGCIYCDSRSVCYNMQHEFEDIEVKENAPELLQIALKSKRKKCMIGTGSMSDPYIPIEKDLLLTRRCLQIIEKEGFGLSILTKSDLILRDLDLLESINTKSKCVVEMTLTTFDDDLAKILEPHVCVTSKRFEVLMKCKEKGIPTIVWLSPFLPFINDTKENLLGILNYCKQASVKGIICFGIGLTLREGNREYFYNKLDQYFPSLKNRYIQTYGNSYEITSSNNNELMKLFVDFCKENNILYKIEDCFDYLNEFPEQFEQTSLF